MASIFLPSMEDVEDICGKEELVTFRDVSCLYCAGQCVTVKYQLGSRVQTHPSDWLGIFPSNWEDLTHPLAKITSLPPVAKTGGHKPKARLKTVTFSGAHIQTLESKDTSYQFVYVDANQHVLGVSMPFKVTEFKAMSDDEEVRTEGSESPVILSSGSEDEGDWELANQSATLRQTLPGVTSAGSSTSDLSDIVVLSSSPSKEAARQLEDAQVGAICDVISDISWNSDTDDVMNVKVIEKSPKIIELSPSYDKQDEIVVSNIKKPKIVELPVEETKTETGPTGGKSSKNSKATKRACENNLGNKTKNSTNDGAKNGSGHQTPICVDVKAKNPAEKLALHKPVMCNFSAWQTPSLLNKLSIVELNNSSDEEDLDKKKIQEQSIKQQRKLVTEIKDCDSKDSEKDKRIKAQTITLTTKKIESVVTAKVSTTEEIAIKSETLNAPVCHVVSSQSKKLKKKRKKDKRREEKLREDTDDEDISSENTHKIVDKKLAEAQEQKLLPEKSSKTQTGTSELKELGLKNYGLLFDEMTDLDTRTQKEKTKLARKQERKAARSKGNIAAKLMEMAKKEELCEELVEISEQKFVPDVLLSEQDETFVKPKSDKKKKQKTKDVKDGSSISTECSTIAEQVSQLSSENDAKPSTMEFHTSRKDAASKQKTVNVSLPGAEMRQLKQKYLTKASKKVKRSNSKQRSSSRPSSGVQYLFTMDYKSTTTKEEKDPENGEDIPLQTYLGPTLPIITIQDTSAEDFPALPSQNEALPIATKMAVPQPITKPQSSRAVLDSDDDADEDSSIEKSVDELGDDQIVPYVPPYVLDLMDALPPASVSPDGLSMVEWRRSLLPLLPKHALPVFHNKYKAKFATKHELRRAKLKRGGQGSRRSAIIDRIKNQLSVPGSLEKIAKKLTRPVSPNKANKMISSVSAKKLPMFSDAPLSYANIVKQNQKPKDETLNEADQPAPETPCLALIPVQNYQTSEKPKIPGLAMNETPTAKTFGGKNKGVISRNFPKEFTKYTSSSDGISDESSCSADPSMLQVVPFNPSVSKFPAPGGPIMHVVGNAIERCSETPRVHARRVAGARSRQLVPVVSTSPPRRAKVDFSGAKKEKTSALLALPAPEYTDPWEKDALLDMALTSSIEDNAELRRNVVCLEHKILELEQELKTLQQEKKQQSSPKHPKDPEDRKVPMFKWSGKVCKLVRSNVEIISLSSKVKENEQEIASLTNQVNWLKEALQAEQKRTTRALTKWFKLKLKVKALRARLRDVKPDSKHPEALSTSSGDVTITSKQRQLLAEDAEPPRKRRKMSTPDETDQRAIYFSGQTSSPPPVVTLASPSLLPSPVLPRPQPPLAQAPHGSPPVSGLFSLFPGQQPGTASAQQAVVAPFQQTMPSGFDQQIMFLQTNSGSSLCPPMATNAQFYTQPARQGQRYSQGFKQRAQRKRSPPHLPLPTPNQPPISPPFRGFESPYQRQSSPPHPQTFHMPARQQRNHHQHEYQQNLAWPYLSSTCSSLESPPVYQTFDQPPPMSVWSSQSPPLTSWSHNNSYDTPYTQNTHNNAAQWVNPYRQEWVDNSRMQHFPDNSRSRRANRVSPQPQLQSPPGRYRSDFLRRMMRGEGCQQSGHPNPYRLFQRPSPPQSTDSHQLSLQQHQTHGYEETQLRYDGSRLAPSTQAFSVDSSIPDSSSYRNNPVFVELTADGLVEGSSRQDNPVYSQTCTSSSNNTSYSNNGKFTYSFSRPIESSKAFGQQIN